MPEARQLVTQNDAISLKTSLFHPAIFTFLVSFLSENSVSDLSLFVYVNLFLVIPTRPFPNACKTLPDFDN